MKKHLMLFALFTATIFYSCKKEVGQSSNANISSLARNPNITPTVQDGILSFTDITQFNAYCDYLDSTMRGDTTNQFDTLEADEKLALIEAEFSYTSLRSVVYAQWESLNEIGWSTGEEIPEIHFINSIVTRSVYNVDRNVRVGTAINHIYNKDYAILIKDGDLTILNKVINLPAGLTEDELLSEFAFDAEVMVYNTQFITEMNNRTVLFKTTEDTSWISNFSLYRISTGTGCDVNNKTYQAKHVSLKVAGLSPGLIYSFGDKLDLWINWGDGTIQTFSNVPILKFGSRIFFPDIPTNHTYSSGGSKTVHIKAKRPFHTTWVGEAWNTIDVPLYNCASWYHLVNGYTSVYNSDGSAYIRACLETHLNFWNNPVFEAHSEAYIKNNGKYKHKKADELVAQMWGDLALDCFSDPFATSSWRKHDRTTEARKVKIGVTNTNYSIIYSNHRVKQNGNWASLDLQLIRCQ